jgi:DNA-binding XRE family transcriptional regulator
MRKGVSKAGLDEHFLMGLQRHNEIVMGVKSMKKSVPKNLQRLREMIGLTQYEVARLTGIDRARLSEIENGRVAPRPEEVPAILKAIRGAHQRQQKEFEQLAAGAEAA